MAIRDACIWVLITDGVTARICSTEDGLATPILAPLLLSNSLDEADDIDREEEERAYRVWFRTESQGLFPGSAKRQLALHLAQLLNEGARDRAFDGLIVVAAPHIRAELQRALSSETQALLLGKVIRDLAACDVVEAGLGSTLCH